MFARSRAILQSPPDDEADDSAWRQAAGSDTQCYTKRSQAAIHTKYRKRNRNLKLQTCSASLPLRSVCVLNFLFASIALLRHTLSAKIQRFAKLLTNINKNCYFLFLFISFWQTQSRWSLQFAFIVYCISAFCTKQQV